MTLKIYGSLRSRGARVVWAAKELGVPYEIVTVLQKRRVKDPAASGVPVTTGTAAYQKISINDRVPNIEDDGLVLFESLAINLYLARKHGGPLAPRDIKEEGQIAQWTVFAATEAEPTAYGFARADEAGKAAAKPALDRTLGILETALKRGGGYLVGGRFTIADINITECVKGVTGEFKTYPAVKAWFESNQQRPACKAMLAEREAEQEMH